MMEKVISGGEVIVVVVVSIYVGGGDEKEGIYWGINRGEGMYKLWRVWWRLGWGCIMIKLKYSIVLYR